MTKRLTTSEFICRAEKIHGKKYSYDDVRYINTNTKVEVICSIHGKFLQTPYDHLNNKGCPKCGRINASSKRRLTTKNFIERSNKIHNGKYNYIDTKYTTARSSVNIICPIHGKFEQIASRHLSGNGCSKCKGDIISKTKRNSVEKFLNAAENSHGKKYSYDGIELGNVHQKIKIHCPIHGIFEQRPYCHTSLKHGCPRCANMGYSKTALKWLDEIAQTKNIFIQHAENIGEFIFPGPHGRNYRADGYCKTTNTIYEFYGDKWHGNIKVFENDEYCHPFIKKTALELYKDTMLRETWIKYLGFSIISIWENNYRGKQNDKS